mmetsp:Transcript_25041/g.54493  ORF Transcript_25041/g.54493 Transcript_25041/m.54493 type:complete len:553 (-) Transcript_25041:72-1730(-)
MPVPDGLIANEEDLEALKTEVRLAVSEHHFERALVAATTALQHARSTGDRRGEGVGLLLQAYVRSALQEHDPEETLAIARLALSTLRGVNDSKGESEALQVILAVEMKWQMHESAAETARSLLDKSSKNGDSHEIAAAQFVSAEALLEAGNRDEAFRLASQALQSYEQLGDSLRSAECCRLAARMHFLAGEHDECIDLATKAKKLFEAAGETSSQAAAILLISKAYLASGQSTQALRSAEDADRLWRQCGDEVANIDALVMIANTKLTICEESPGKAVFATMTSIVKSADYALARAKKLRPDDAACMASVLHMHARVLLKTNAPKGAWIAAKAAARNYKRVNDVVGRASALLLWSEADMQLGYLGDARNTADTAFAIFEQLGDDEGKNRALELMDDINKAAGIPTRAEIAEQQRRQLEWQQQQQLRLMQQAQTGVAMPPIPDVLQTSVEEAQEKKEGAAVFQRTGEALKVSAGMDVAVIRNKISEITTAILGDMEGVEVDTPLMEAGLTSNTAMLLRDELSKDLPGIKLPPTLLFDYPSISTMADYIVDQAE